MRGSGPPGRDAGCRGLTGLRTRAPAGILRPVSAPRDFRDLVDHPIPDLSLPASTGGDFALRPAPGSGPLVLFFYLLNGTPT